MSELASEPSESARIVRIKPPVYRPKPSGGVYNPRTVRTQNGFGQVFLKKIATKKETTQMHRQLPDPQVHPYPHPHHEHSSADEKAGLLNNYCGPGQTDCPVLSDEYDLDVGLAGALQ